MTGMGFLPKQEQVHMEPTGVRTCVGLDDGLAAEQCQWYLLK